MKRIACFILSAIVLLSFFNISYAETTEKNWQSGYCDIINITTVSKDTHFVLVDTDYDKVPELFCGQGSFVTAFTYKNNSVVKLYESRNIPIEYIINMKTFYNPVSSITEFVGQYTLENGNSTTYYKLAFSEGGVSSEIIAEKDALGYFKSVSLVPHTISVLDSSEINKAEEKSAAAARFFERYAFLDSLSDDTASFSFEKREEIKKTVAKGSLLCFDKISRIGDSNIFVQFYVTDSKDTSLVPKSKNFACLSEIEDVKPVFFESESEIDTELLLNLKSAEYDASNIYIDCGKVSSFLNFDEHANYLTNLLSESGKIANENGKKAIFKYVEYAVNKSARTKIKSKNNVCTIDGSSISFIVEYAISCMDKMISICASNGLTSTQDLENIPELVCSGVDLSQPVRIEFKAGTANSLSGVSGLKIMLDNSHGVYVSAKSLASLEASVDSFCIEITHTPGKISATFSDRNNNIIEKLEKKVYFILPAGSKYSSVVSTTEKGTEISGGTYDPLNKTIKFGTNHSATYDVVEKDITINDIDKLTEDSCEAIRYLVSRGILSAENNKFNPNASLSNYEFTSALIKLFYEKNPEALSSFEDVPEDSEYYAYIASAESLGLTSLVTDTKFNGERTVTREVAVALCGRTLVKKGGFAYPEDANKSVSFSDRGRISEAAIADIAVALDAGAIDASRYFSPQKKLTRKEGAELLYNTYMALYNAPSVTTVSAIQEVEKPVANDENQIDWELRAAAIIVFAFIVLFVGYIIRKLIKRRKRLKASK